MLFGFSQTFGPRRLSVRQFCDHLGQREIFGIVDVDPLDAVYDGDVGVSADALITVAPYFAAEDEERAGLDEDRFDLLRTGNRVERIVERLAPVPGEGLHPNRSPRR